MKAVEERKHADAPEVTTAQLAELRARLLAASSEPLLPTGFESRCPNCGGKMLTTNDLEESIAAPGLVFVVTRLPGARCLDCGSVELDGRAIALRETTTPREIVADFETAVTHSSGSTLGTYFKMDLVRVLRLSGRERLLWKVVDRDHALVEVTRTTPVRPANRRSRGRNKVDSRSSSKSSKRGDFRRESSPGTRGKPIVPEGPLERRRADP